MANGKSQDLTKDRIAAAKEIGDAILGLRRNSERAGLAFLTRILEMAYEEAFMTVNRVLPSQEDLDEAAQLIERTKMWEREKKRSA